MSKIRKKAKSTKTKFVSPFKDYWRKENIIFLSIGIVLLIIGYWLMSLTPWDNPIALNFSPIVLLIAYLIFIPLSIFYKKKSVNKS
ncbi:MAG: DUF3098 domain-containing protein [Chlorobi bacterium]|nr:DUF3098 domain-containing protein [Chlorobiota bacterium]